MSTHIHTQIHTLPHTQIDTNILYNRKSFFYIENFIIIIIILRKYFSRQIKVITTIGGANANVFFLRLLHSFFGMEFFAFIFFAAYFSYSWIFSFVCLLIIVAFLWFYDNGTRCPVIYLQQREKKYIPTSIIFLASKWS